MPKTSPPVSSQPGSQSSGNAGSRRSSASLARTFRLPAIACAAILALCVLAARPFAEIGLSDDWSYIWMARITAATGRIAYDGWAAMILGWQLYLGAAFLKLFGDSFLAPRIAILLLAMATMALLQRLLVRCGVTPFNASVATLTLGLSPIFLPLSFVFMTDIPGLFCIVLCFYMCVRAVQAASDHASVGWIVAAALVNLLDGTVRQVVWLGVLIVVPCTAWYLRRRRGVPVAAAMVWCLSAVVVELCLHWYSRQPYTMVEKLFVVPTHRADLVLRLKMAIAAILEYPILLLPLIVAPLAHLPWRSPRFRNAATAVGAVLVLFFGMVATIKSSSLKHLPFVGNVVGPIGTFDTPDILGNRPEVLTVPIRAALGLLTALGVAATLYMWRFEPARTIPQHPALQTVEGPGETPLPATAIAWIFLPYTAVYLGLIFTRLVIYDRYLLPAMVVALLLLTRLYQSRCSGRLPAVSIVLLVVMGLASCIGFYDFVAFSRARLAAADELRQAGVPRRDIAAGFEYNAWTQLELAGYFNEPTIKIPAGAYHAPPPSQLPAACQLPGIAYTPALTPRYILSFDPVSCYPASSFPAVEYHSWLPPFRHRILILQQP